MGDVDAFAEKINHLVESPKLLREMGEYNRAKVERIVYSGVDGGGVCGLVPGVDMIMFYMHYA